jgi:hypothetical protein
MSKRWRAISGRQVKQLVAGGLLHYIFFQKFQVKKTNVTDDAVEAVVDDDDDDGPHTSPCGRVRCV